MNYKILKQSILHGVYTGKPTKYSIIKVYNEPSQVKNYKFKTDHIYQVLPGDENNPHQYRAPVNQPNINIAHNFNVYRKKMGLMLPKQIKSQRRKYHLTQRELAALLGISYSTISNIENNEIIQSISQDTLLRTLLLNPKVIAKLIQTHTPLIKNQHLPHVNVKKLNKKAKQLAQMA